MSTTIQKCSTCRKGVGLYTCAGCHSYFCGKDLKIHREQLDGEMVVLMGDRNDFQDKMNKNNQIEDLPNVLLDRVKTWEMTTIEKIKQIAEQTREQIIQTWNFKRKDILVQFDMFSQELVHLKTSEEYLEHDITRLKQTMIRLNDHLKQLTEQTAVQVNIEQTNRISWDRIIYVENKSTSMTTYQQPTAIIGMHFSPVMIHSMSS